MLSKSQARSFFLLGTAACSLAFIALTIDTFKQVPAQTRQQNLGPEAIRGKHLWDKNNCMGCHTLLGEGAYYAPELTKVYERRGEAFIKAMIKDPAAMYPGERKMVNYHFNDQEISDLVAFFKWIGEADLNGFPPKPDLIKTAAPDSSIAKQSDRPMVFNQMCISCHMLEGQGGSVGPALDGVGSRLDADLLKKRLLDPKSVLADSKMPKLPLTDADVTELVAYLSQLKAGK